MHVENGAVGDSPLFTLLPEADGARPESLEQLSRQPIATSDEDTSLIRRTARAWRTPLEQLTCEEARLLLSQGMGMKWLASPICELLLLRPDVEVSFYPGDLAHAALVQFDELMAHAPDRARQLLEDDFDWIAAQRAIDREFGSTLAGEAEKLLSKARKAAAH